MHITKDKREIKWLILPDNVEITVGSYGVTKIEAYDEYGQGAYIPWFKVWKGNHLDCRVNAAYVEQVAYKEDDNVGN